MKTAHEQLMWERLRHYDEIQELLSMLRPEQALAWSQKRAKAALERAWAEREERDAAG